jgi:hypothetical protein
MIEITCPVCSSKGGLNAMHRHMVDTHSDLVHTEIEEETGKMHYVIECPICPLKYQHSIKPRYRDPSFLEEFKREIAMVAFDQMLYHLLKEHALAVGVNPQDIEQLSD